MPKKKPSHKIPESEPKGPSSPEEAREWLEAAARHLSEWPYASRGLRFVGYTLKKYLRDPETHDLHKQLGLVNPVGRPSNFGTRMREREQGRKIVTLKDTGKPWHSIGDEVGVKDKRSLKRLYDKYSSLLPKEKQLAELDRFMKNFLDEETRQRLKSS